MIILNQSMRIEQKLCYTNTDSFIIHHITEDFYRDIADDVKNGLIHLTMMRTIKDLFQ